MVIPNHVNNSLPPLDLFIYVKVGEEFLRVKRKAWAESHHPDSITVFNEDDKQFVIPMGAVQWFYP